MCGICGINWSDKELIERMSSVLEHRGPDWSGNYVNDSISLGHRRLRIIDLSHKGNQPMCNEDETIWIVYNGEVYNYMDIRRELENKGHRFRSDTDTEVIIHAYEEYKEKCLDYFNGDFAFAIYDSLKNRLLLARDRLGIKPLYYFLKDGQLIFASEIKAILECEEVKREVDMETFNRFIAFRYNAGKATLFKGITKLMPGTYMKFDLRDGKLLIKKYWEINCSSISGENEGILLKRFLTLFEDSVEKRLISDVPLGVFLSGGIDSSSVVAMMSNINRRSGNDAEIKTFSVGFGYEESDELDYARKVSEFFGTKHEEFVINSEMVKLLPKIVWHLDEPMGDPALIPLYILSKKSKNNATVILTGDGSDEIFAGYEHYKFITISKKFSWIPRAVRKNISKFSIEAIPLYIFDRIFKYSSSIGKKGAERAVNVVSSAEEPLNAYFEFVSLFNAADRKELYTDGAVDKVTDFSFQQVYSEYFKRCNNNLLNQLLYLETKTTLPENFLMKNDKICMANAVEARVPFLDHRLVEFSFTLPPKLKLNLLNEKYILKKSMMQYLPKEIVDRKKQRFYVPVDMWLMKELKPVVEELVSAENIKRQGYFNYDYIKKLFKNYDKSKLFYGRQLWNILTFQLWHKIYIEGENWKKITM